MEGIHATGQAMPEASLCPARRHWVKYGGECVAHLQVGTPARAQARQPAHGTTALHSRAGAAHLRAQPQARQGRQAKGIGAGVGMGISSPPAVVSRIPARAAVGWGWADGQNTPVPPSGGAG
jgi:hypothetical protein